MLTFYGFPSPNCLKIAIMLEECGLDYVERPVNILAGEQFSADFLAISPNNKVPALTDETPSGTTALFESGAILEYLAEKTGRFLGGQDRWTVKQWLYWQMAGLGPMAGQAHHFRAFASENVPYAIKRYTEEVNRLYGVLDRRLQGRAFVAGAVSIADFACWPWIAHHERQGQALAAFSNVQRWFEAIGVREGVGRAVRKGTERQAPLEAYRYLYGQTAETAARVQSEGGER